MILLSIFVIQDRPTPVPVSWIPFSLWTASALCPRDDLCPLQLQFLLLRHPCVCSLFFTGDLGRPLQKVLREALELPCRINLHVVDTSFRMRWTMKKKKHTDYDQSPEGRTQTKQNLLL